MSILTIGKYALGIIGGVAVGTAAYELTHYGMQKARDELSKTEEGKLDEALVAGDTGYVLKVLENRQHNEIAAASKAIRKSIKKVSKKDECDPETTQALARYMLSQISMQHASKKRLDPSMRGEFKAALECFLAEAN